MKTIIAINKPKGPTSHDIVDMIRKITGIRKVGHAGTLDPLASGVLVLGITREGTKQMAELVKTGKEYIATIKLGENSVTDDEEGEKTKYDFPEERISSYEAVKEILPIFIGNIEQIPPIYSAIKVKGKTAYKEARKGNEIKLEPRKVEIKEIEILSFEWPILKLRVATGSGVYIRSLARDIGKELGVGGYLADLVRTRVGNFKLDQSLTLEEFDKEFKELEKG